MKNFVDIIFFGNDWFGENKTSSHHIAERLSQKIRVLYIECPGLRAPKTNKRDIKKIIKKILKSLKPPQKLNEKFYVYTLLQIPFLKFAIVRHINSKIVPIFIKIMMRYLKIKKPLLWFMLPHLTMVINQLNEIGVVYYCIDDYSALPGVDQKTIISMDSEMSLEANIVFVASMPIYEKKKKNVKNLILSPHGVDFEHFFQSTLKKTSLPKELPYFYGPVIGFWGLIEKWIDLNLVKFLSDKHPEWTILMIGYLSVTDNPCINIPNVFFLGPKSFNELPIYASIFNAAILPYKLNKQVYNCNPIKLREYLSAGLPVVSVRYPEVEKYSDVVSIADSYEQFTEMVELSLLEDSEEKIAKRVNRVRNESWDSRIEFIHKKIENEFNLHII